jgi:hypothetical protein
MAVFDDLYRLGAAAALTVASAAGAAVSTGVFGTETYAIALSFPGSTSSTSGVRIKIVDPSTSVVTSTGDFLLPANWVEKIKVSPGQRLSALSNDAGTPSLSIVELTK